MGRNNIIYETIETNIRDYRFRSLTIYGHKNMIFIGTIESIIQNYGLNGMPFVSFLMNLGASFINTIIVFIILYFYHIIIYSICYFYTSCIKKKGKYEY